MNPPSHRSSTRREFLYNTGRIAAVSALAGTVVPHVHAAESNTIQVALIGCGGRGTGATINALSAKDPTTSVPDGNIKLVAMADAFQDRLDRSHKTLASQFEGGKQIDVPADRQFVGLDAYQQAMDCLKPGDVAIFATPPAFRWVHFDYAIKKGLNVFMEKPVSVDGPTSRRMLKLADESEKKGLKVGVGLHSRHARHMQQLAEQLGEGKIGDILLIQAYRMQDSYQRAAKTAKMSDLEYQIRKFLLFLWASGGVYSDYNIHAIDNCCWMKGASLGKESLWPVRAMGLGGRHYRENSMDQNFDSYAVEYAFADGTKMIMGGRCISGCEVILHIYAHGTKGSAVVAKTGECGAPCSIHTGQLPAPEKKVWESSYSPVQQVQQGLVPYQTEWDDLIAAIRADKPFNEARRGVEASLVTSMGRISAHTGHTVTYEELLNSPYEYAPNLDKLTFDSPAPVMPDANGKYPVPQPGIITNVEYQLPHVTVQSTKAAESDAEMKALVAKKRAQKDAQQAKPKN